MEVSNNVVNADEIIQEDLGNILSRLQNEFKQLAGCRVVLTGGAGFLGYYLVQSICAFNKNSSTPIQLVVLDNFIRGLPEWLKNLDGSVGLEIRRHDITEPFPSDIEQVDWIIHAASIASPIYYREHPIETMDANVNGLRILLDKSRELKNSGKPIKGFLYFSTSEIYGDPSPDSIPTPESYRGLVSCTGPRACYDESKRYGETLCVNFAQQFDLPITIARPFNNFGPGLKITDKRVIPDFVRNIFRDEDIVMLSDGSPTRTFCYIADAITGYFKVLVNGKPGESYNIGVETPEISMYELAQKLSEFSKELFGYKGQVIRQQSSDSHYLTDNPNRRCPIIEKARKDLGYSPEFKLDDALRRSLIWYQSNQVAEEK